MTSVYTKCEICNKWTLERLMDYFSGIGLVCNSCGNEILKKDVKK